MSSTNKDASEHEAQSGKDSNRDQKGKGGEDKATKTVNTAKKENIKR